MRNLVVGEWKATVASLRDSHDALLGSEAVLLRKR